MIDCDHPQLYTRNQFGGLDRVSPCLYCERDALDRILESWKREELGAADQPAEAPLKKMYFYDDRLRSVPSPSGWHTEVWVAADPTT